MNADFTLKKVADKTLIYDGTDDHFYEEHSFTLENGDTIVFSITNLSGLIEFEKENRSKINQILEECKGVHKFDLIPELAKYRSEEELTVSYKESDNYIAIISDGEFQPCRYKIYIEGVFIKNLIS